MSLLPLLLIIFSTASIARSDPTMSDFFGVSGNLTKITWAHAVNSQDDLKKALDDTSVMMLEADVRIGNITGDSKNIDIPIMSHDANKESDLSLQNFLDQVTDFNAKNTDARKGVKLDFKTNDAFTKSVDIISSVNKTASDYPIWLNADIVKGPLGAAADVKAADFLKTSSKFNTSVYSLGWTTGSIKNGSAYDISQIEEMVKTIKDTGIQHEITFALRAALVPNSLNVLQNLTTAISETKVSSWTITLWSSNANDLNITDIDALRTYIVETVGLDKVYLDVPEDFARELNLPSSAVTTKALGGAFLLVLLGLIKSLINF